MVLKSEINIIDDLNNSEEEMMEKIINQKTDNLFYALPKKQLEYLDEALGVNICEDSWYKWIEYKARRDVIIHNSGIINDVYILKVNGYGQFTNGNEVIFNKQEFSDIVSNLKTIIGGIDRLIRIECHIPFSKKIKELAEQN